MKNANPSGPDGRYHAVRFYPNDKALAHIIAEFLGGELGPRQPGIIVATPAHRAAILRELVARDLDVVRLQRSGDLLLLDAQETLSTFMRNGEPDGERFRARMCEVIRTARRGRMSCTLRIYGQMVDILWKNGNHDAAIRLEVLWNQLANTEDFSLLCGYAMGHFYKDANFDSICRQHTHLISADREAAAVA